MMAAEPVMVPVFVVGLAQLPASILALPDMEATVMPPDTSPTTVIFAFPLISACSYVRTSAALGKFQARAHHEV